MTLFLKCVRTVHVFSLPFVTVADSQQCLLRSLVLKCLLKKAVEPHLSKFLWGLDRFSACYMTLNIS